ncbi:MAG: hypothetical protein WC335_08265 [Candidatus Omnitrophota bacterium]|jgi:glutamate synthase domain-containing protein 3
MKTNNGAIHLDAKGMHYRELNERIHQAVSRGTHEIILDHANGQRYIGDALRGDVRIIVNGVLGNDSAAFMDGPTIIVHANAQDGIGNTMNSGKVIVHGSAGDITGYAMRGGRIYIRGDAGYRVGIHMKSYKESYPVIVIGGCAGDFLGEYMAGGLMVVLGLDKKKEDSLVGNYCATGMHGGAIYLRGEVEAYRLSTEIQQSEAGAPDREILQKYLREYCRDFSLDLKEVMGGRFIKLAPSSHRPYGKLYAY